MAPGYRTNTQTRRGARSGFPEHDDFEGLPVRQWRLEEVTIAPPQEIEDNKKDDRWAIELPHGMPKDSEMLPAHSQALLRAARSGALYKRPAPADDDDVDGDGLPGDKPEKKVSAMSQGFQVGIWKKVPRNAEGPSVSHLAKRHKGTITLPSKALATQITGPMITKATVRRIDAAGNPYTQEVTIADGQQVDGEIISTSVVPAPEQPAQTTPAAGTPGRRKPPLPQKKNRRGRGRGRGRGRMMLPTSTRPDPQTGAVPDGASEVKAEGTATAGVKIEAEDSKTVQDVEMVESSVLDEEGDEGEGDGDDDDEGDGDESGTPAENEDQEMEDAPSLPPPVSSSAADATPTPNLDASESVMAPALPGLRTDASRVEGSPLKNVIIRSPIEAPPHISPIAATSSTEVGLSGVPGEPTLGLQPSPLEHSQPDTASLPVEEVAEVGENSTQPEETAAPVSAETAPEEMTGVVAITAQEPEAPLVPLPEQPAISLSAVEQPAVEEDTQPSLADIPLPTSEEPMPGQDPIETKPAPAPAPEPEPEPEPEPAPEPETALESETALEPETAPEPETVPQPQPQLEAQPPQEPEKEVEMEIDAGEEAGQKVEEEPEKGPGNGPEEEVEKEKDPEMEPETHKEPEEKQEKEPEKEASIGPKEEPKDELEKEAPIEAKQEEPTEPVPEEPSAAAETAIAGPPAAATEEGADDGLDLLGPLGASLNLQAEEEVPAPAPAPPAE